MNDEVEASTDDYALEAVPEQSRMQWHRVVIITLGLMGAMVFLQVSGEMALQYGVANAIAALVYATILTGVLASVLAYYAAKYGLNCSLITRASGFGHAGARVTALFYAANFIALAAIEGSIMANAAHEYIDWISVRWAMVILTVVNIALNWYGIKWLERFQRFSLPIYLLLLIAVIVFAMQTTAAESFPIPHGLTGSGFLAGAGILNGIVALQALLTADYARFTKSPRLGRMIVIGFIPQIASFLIMGLIGIWFATRFNEANPGVYLVLVLGGWGALYVVLSQMRINVINIYSGSLSLEGLAAYFLRGAGHRTIWVVLTSILALFAMLFGILEHLSYVLTFLGSFMFAWVAILMAELLVVRRLLRRADVALEFRVENLPAWGKTGLPAVLVGAIIGGYFALFANSAALNAASGFIAGAVGFTLHLVLAYLTRNDRHAPTNGI